MDTEERDRLITAWITYANAEEDTPAYQDNIWAAFQFSDLIRDEPSDGGDAEVAWEIILSINERSLSEEAMALLAAGQLEDLLVYHGELFIERVEAQAHQDPAFNLLLGGVWKNAMSEDVWQRVQAARNEVW